MRLEVNGSIVSVLGVPNSGTTIVNNTLNSMQNGFCISEPHWILRLQRKQLKLDKAGNIRFTSADDFMDGVAQRVRESRFEFGGVKETYRPFDGRMKNIYEKVLAASDLVIVTFRDPAALYNSHKSSSKNKTGTNIGAVQKLHDIYKASRALLDQYSDKAVPLVLEDYCRAGDAGAIEFLNKTLKGKAKVRGKFALQRTKFIFGNDKANKSVHISPPNMDVKLVTPDEHKALQIIYPIYNELRSGA